LLTVMRPSHRLAIPGVKGSLDLMTVRELVQASPDSPIQPLHVLVVGAGVVGHAEGTALREHGHDVVFSDVDEAVLAQRRTEGSTTIPMAELDLVGVDVVLVTVSTPTSAGGIDLRQLEAALATIGDALGGASSSEPG